MLHNFEEDAEPWTGSPCENEAWVGEGDSQLGTGFGEGFGGDGRSLGKEQSSLEGGFMPVGFTGGVDDVRSKLVVEDVCYYTP